jgi:hypothetical protein
MQRAVEIRSTGRQSICATAEDALIRIGRGLPVLYFDVVSEPEGTARGFGLPGRLRAPGSRVSLDLLAAEQARC